MRYANLRLYAGAFLVAFFTVTVAWSHSQNPDSGITVETDYTQSVTTFPLKVIGGDFELIDHDGKQVTNKSYQGRHLLVFFGYIGCKSMCSISLARIGKVLTLLGGSVNKLAPLVITVDPKRDTPEVMKAALHKFHPQLIGLTGTADKLQAAYQSYKQKPTLLGNDDNDDAIISHSSYIYLIDNNGEFVTLMPPILTPESMTKIIHKYIDDAS